MARLRYPHLWAHGMLLRSQSHYVLNRMAQAAAHDAPRDVWKYEPKGWIDHFTYGFNPDRRVFMTPDRGRWLRADVTQWRRTWSRRALSAITSKA